MSGSGDGAAPLRRAYQEALAQEGRGDRAGALAKMEALAAAYPQVGELWNAVGTMRMGLGRTRQAEEAFRQALAVEAGHRMARRNLAAALAWRGATGQALPLLAEAFQQAPEDTGVQVQLGNLLAQTGNLDTAEKMFRRALALQPGLVPARAGLAALCERRGAPQEARELLQEVVQTGRAGPNALATWATASGRLGRALDAVGPLEAALSGQPPAAVAAHLGHVLGDLYVRLERWDDAFAAHRAANLADQPRYDPVAARQRIDRILREGDSQEGWHPATPLPGPRLVFVVGMPRSGTSLIEQIIGVHPAAHPTGERGELPEAIAQLIARHAPGGTWVDLRGRLGAADLTNLARWYRQRVCADAGTAAVVTDKMPLNWPYVGLLPRIFPNCRVVWATREPRDNAVSCFFSNFLQSYAFSTRLDWLGWTIADQQRARTHWHHAPFLRTQVYEDLVRDQEGETRQLLAHVGLPWDSSCLRFHTHRRTVNTASYAQIQRPMYQSSVGRAARYRHHLGPLEDALAGRTAP